jgi:2-polyprenyl-3-methyl-5-hydroxy-6-metoxy-1,4-benzoquinol methylase
MSGIQERGATVADQTCPGCGTMRTQRFLDVPDLNFTPRLRPATILKCGECGLYFLWPRPTQADLDALYKVERVFSRPTINPNAEKLLFHQFETFYRRYGDDTRFIVERTLKLAPPAPAVLDIGCSTGRLLSRFFAHGADVAGIDVDPGAKIHASPDVREHIWTGDVLDYPEGRAFDVVVLKFVIEHMPDPWPILRKVRALLKPHGIFVLATPDIGSPKAKAEGADWRNISERDQPIGHCLWFDHEAIRRMLTTSGFSAVSIRNRGDAIDHAPLWLRRGLEMLFGRTREGRFIRSYHLRILWAVLVDSFLSEQMGWGDSMYVFARHCPPSTATP